ncbi:MAG TPA: protease HtpX, partial [Buchnera sp. (in: enterobacteria)]|nr:protease HtpX [Buchnera sp. (in: enterobacteria)]
GFSGALISLFLSKWIALRSVNGKIIKKPTNTNEKWLIHTIHQQSYKMGIIPPDVAIYHSLDINAFATGANRNAALIAVSTGLLEHMNQHEAEAVIAHEMSHITNGDMVTMTLLQGVVNTIVIFTSHAIAQIIDNFISNHKENSNIKNNNSFVYIIISTVLELMFGIFASIITMWFSRHREFHADAGAAKLVGAKKMIAALEKLKTSYEPQEKNNVMAFCINGKNKSIINLFHSHPTLEKRINALYKKEYIS